MSMTKADLWPGACTAVRLTEKGVARVLEGKPGMTFVVNTFTPTTVGFVAHVIDFRYPRPETDLGFQTWSIGPDGYEGI